MKLIIIVILICMLALFLLKVPVYISMALTGCALMMATTGIQLFYHFPYYFCIS